MTAGHWQKKWKPFIYKRAEKNEGGYDRCRGRTDRINGIVISYIFSNKKEPSVLCCRLAITYMCVWERVCKWFLRSPAVHSSCIHLYHHSLTFFSPHVIHNCLLFTFCRYTILALILKRKLIVNVKSDSTVKMRSLSSSYVKYGTTQVRSAICLRSQTYRHSRILTHVISHNMQKCLHVRHHVYVNINPAGTVFKCQTFNLLNLTRGGVQACQSPATTCRETRYRRKNK